MLTYNNGNEIVNDNYVCCNNDNQIMMLVQVVFSLPYTEFLPDVVPFVFCMSGETLELCTFLPETNTSHDILASLNNSVLQVTDR